MASLPAAPPPVFIVGIAIGVAVHLVFSTVVGLDVLLLVWTVKPLNEIASGQVAADGVRKITQSGLFQLSLREQAINHGKNLRSKQLEKPVLPVSR